MWYKSASRSSCVGEGIERVSGERFDRVPSVVVESSGKRKLSSVTGAAPEAAHMRLVAFE
jgi:ribosomal protein S12 methylthiotransferase accessory factor YcaO